MIDWERSAGKNRDVGPRVNASRSGDGCVDWLPHRWRGFVGKLELHGLCASWTTSLCLSRQNPTTTSLSLQSVQEGKRSPNPAIDVCLLRGNLLSNVGKVPRRSDATWTTSLCLCRQSTKTTSISSQSVQEGKRSPNPAVDVCLLREELSGNATSVLRCSDATCVCVCARRGNK